MSKTATAQGSKTTVRYTPEKIERGGQIVVSEDKTPPLAKRRPKVLPPSKG